MYVAAAASGTVSVFDLTRNQVVATIKVPGAPNCIALDPARATLHVTSSGRLLTINTRTNRMTKTASMGSMLSCLAVDVVRHAVYVTDSSQRRLWRVDDQGRKAIALPEEPEAVAVDPKAGRVFVLAPSSGKLLVLGPDSRVTRTVDVAPGTSRLIRDEKSGRVYASNNESGGVFVFDPDQPVPVTRLADVPSALALELDPEWGVLHVVTTPLEAPEGAKGELVLVSASSGRILDRVPVGVGPWAVSVDTKTHQAFVANLESSDVSVVAVSRK